MENLRAAYRTGLSSSQYSAPPGGGVEAAVKKKDKNPAIRVSRGKR